MLGDLRYALRVLRLNPGFASAAIVALGLGIGAATAIFSVFDIVLLRGLPFPGADRLVTVVLTQPHRRDSMAGKMDFVVSREYLNWTVSNRVFESYAARWYSINQAVLADGDRAVEIRPCRVTTNFLATLGVAPVLGRAFMADESRMETATPMIISYGLWQDKFAGDRRVLGRSVTLDGAPVTIVGVTPKNFYFPASLRVDAMTPIKYNLADVLSGKTMGGWETFGRLKPGVSISQARADFLTLFAASAAADHVFYKGDVEISLMPMQERLTGNVRAALWILLAGVGCVLLIACANVANLLLARASGRQKEIATRAALGARRFRLIRQLLTESALLGLVGGAAGAALAWIAVLVLRRVGPEELPRIAELSIDWRVLAFAVLISLVTGIAFGLAPALSATRTAVRFGRSGPRDFLVAAEIALSLTLLIGAGLLIESLWRMRHNDPGFAPENLITANVSARGARLVDLRDRLMALPGTQSVALADSLPPDGGSSLGVFSRQGRPLPEPGHRGDNRLNRHVGAGYFETLRIPLKRGRWFTEGDRPDVVVINEALAREFFPGENPLGQRVDVLRGSAGKTIVGIVGDVKNQGLGKAPMAEEYEPLGGGERELYVMVRTLAGPSTAAAVLREIDLQGLASMHTMNDHFDQLTARPRFNGALFGSFAGVALLLAMVGVYGVVSFTVARRAFEIGVRMALGADRARILRMILRHALIPTGAGIGAWLAGSVVVSRYLVALLYDVKPVDPFLYATVAGVLGVVAVGAALVPARRAALVDPVAVLRAE
jgi:putative ABC transport system permease protein